MEGWGEEGDDEGEARWTALRLVGCSGARGRGDSGRRRQRVVLRLVIGLRPRVSWDRGRFMNGRALGPGATGPRTMIAYRGRQVAKIEADSLRSGV